MGRSPDLVEDQITYPLVRALQSTPGIATVRGYSMFGMSFTYAIFARRHRHLLGAHAGARAAGARAATAAARCVPDARARRERSGMGLPVRLEGQHRTDGSRRAAGAAGLHRPARAAGGRRCGGSRVPRRIRTPVSDRGRPRPAGGLRAHADRCHAIGARRQRGSRRPRARTGRSRVRAARSRLRQDAGGPRAERGDRRRGRHADPAR